MPGTELAVVRDEPAAVGQRDVIDGWVAMASDVFKLASHICDTGFVPKTYRGNAPAVAAAILTGRELGIGPMASLRHVQVVEGSPGLSAEYKRARVLAAGHEFAILEWTNSRCKVRGRRRNSPDSLEVTYSIDDAKKAGLIRARSAWETRPRRMLFARAGTDLCDALFSDVVNGLPTADLLAEGTADDEFAGYDEARDQAPAAPAARTARRRSQPKATQDEQPAAPAASEPQAPADSLPPLPGEEEEAAPGDERHRKLVGAIQGHMHRLGFAVDDGDRAERLPILAKLAGISYDEQAITSTGDFDHDELKVIADTLARCKDRAKLTALLEAGETDG